MLVRECGNTEWNNSQLGIIKVKVTTFIFFIIKKITIKHLQITKAFTHTYLDILGPLECIIQDNF